MCFMYHLFKKYLIYSLFYYLLKRELKSFQTDFKLCTIGLDGLFIKDLYQKRLNYKVSRSFSLPGRYILHFCYKAYKEYLE